MWTVDRSCLVCEWHGSMREPSDTPQIGVECPACKAPTERIRVIRVWPRAPNAHAVALGRLGGLRGGRARAETLSPQRRAEIARAAAIARWSR